jgi:hypothetical protein
MAYVSTADKADGSPIGYTVGEDTLNCGGCITTDSSWVIFAGVPLGVGSDIVITRLVNVTNRDSSDYTVHVCVGVEDFGTELSSLRLYLVSPSGAETLVVELDDFGDVVTERVSVRIPQREEWSLKLAGRYDSEIPPSQSNTMILVLQAIE